MIVTIRPTADPDAVQRAMAGMGLWVRRLDGAAGVQFVVEPGSAHVAPDALRALDGVADVAAEASPHPLLDAQEAVVPVNGVPVAAARTTEAATPAPEAGPGAPGAPGSPGSAPAPVLMAGPCSVESEAQIHEIAGGVSAAGGAFLRGGAFKTRTSPYSFQGNGEPALKWLREAADANNLRVVTEALSPEQVPLVARYADLIQVGSRNMQNSPLLSAAAAQDRPILLKRGMAATIDEWLLAGEYCLLHGAPAVIFCERGIRTFDASTRNLLDLAAVALLATVHGLPVIVDPSHATGRRDLLRPLTRAAVAAGAAGVMLETHPDPGSAMSDASQALPLDQLADLARELRPEPAAVPLASGPVHGD